MNVLVEFPRRNRFYPVFCVYHFRPIHANHVNCRHQWRVCPRFRYRDDQTEECRDELEAVRAAYPNSDLGPRIEAALLSKRGNKTVCRKSVSVLLYAYT